MRVIQIRAEQAHAVPSVVMDALGPFRRYEPEMDESPYADPDSFPPGATAQNNMTEVFMYECRLCGAVVREPDIDYHQCGEGED